MRRSFTDKENDVKYIWGSFGDQRDKYSTDEVEVIVGAETRRAKDVETILIPRRSLIAAAARLRIKGAE